MDPTTSLMDAQWLIWNYTRLNLGTTGNRRFYRFPGVCVCIPMKWPIILDVADSNGDGYFDEQELEALFTKEVRSWRTHRKRRVHKSRLCRYQTNFLILWIQLEKIYDPTNEEDDMVEMEEERLRMREHVMNEASSTHGSWWTMRLLILSDQLCWFLTGRLFANWCVFSGGLQQGQTGLLGWIFSCYKEKGISRAR